MLKWISKIFSFKNSYPTIILLFGVICLGLGFFYSYETENSIWQKIWSKLGDVLLISSILSFLTSTAESLGVFRKALEEIVYDTKHLRKRKDIEDIWEKVSKELFKSKFPQISHNLLSTIKKNYLPEDEVSYYENYKNIYDIKYDENDSKFITVKNDISFILHSNDTSSFYFPMKNWICAEKKEDVSYEIVSIKVNGKPVNAKLITEEFKNKEVSIHHQIKLCGQTEYFIEQSIEKRYSIKCDNFIAFQAKWLVNNLTVQLFHPKEIDVKFINRAASESFNLVKKKDNYLEYEYKGLILRRQGYIMILNTN